MNFELYKDLRIPEGVVDHIKEDGVVLWRRDYAYRYVSLGDSIAAGHTINAEWETDYGEKSQYGVNGNTETVIVPGCYTQLLHSKLEESFGKNRVLAKSFARSGDTVANLMSKLDHSVVREAIAKADLVTLCIGANDVLQPAMMHLDEYINTGSMETLEAVVEANLATLNNDSASTSYKALFDKLMSINPNAKYVFTTVYNPYKYLWIEEGTNGFFAPLLATIPDIDILGFDIDGAIKQGLLNTSIVQLLFSRVNGLGAWAEKYVTRLNEVLRSKIDAYTQGDFLLADTKAVFDPVPDRPISAPKHYNDLVSVEYTRGYNTETMDWGKLWKGSNAGTFWLNLATKYTSLSGFDIVGFSNDLVNQMIEKVITPDIDPHPETYGHHALKCSFEDVLGWSKLPRRVLGFNANGGGGSMAMREIVALDNMTAYTNIPANAFTIPSAGYYFDGWKGSNGASYTNGQHIGLSGDLTLTAQWSNVYRLTYRHTNHTGGLYGDNETGHQECYALYINGELKPKFGTFAQGSNVTYEVPYGATIRVVVSNYNPSELLYDDVNCDVYWNGVSVAKGYRGTEYTFNLPGNIDVDFRWKIAGSLATFDAQSWEDCYITTL